MSGRCVKMIHQKCRQGVYPFSNVKRYDVPEEKVPWQVEYPDYSPPEYTAATIANKPWADPDVKDASFKPKWNAVDGTVNRTSFVRDYLVNRAGYPLNPIGRTGLIGRGLLGRWGPNHAADPIVTRWKRNGTGALEIDKDTEKPVLRFVAIRRRDSGEWAIPGGMVDPGETVSVTLIREFMEEAMCSLEKGTAEKEELKNLLNGFFAKGKEIYKGYVDDPRNTDNAWIETVALNFHDEDDSVVGNFTPAAGDDASDVRWTDVDGKLQLYANHRELLQRTAHKRNAHW